MIRFWVYYGKERVLDEKIPFPAIPLTAKRAVQMAVRRAREHGSSPVGPIKDLAVRVVPDMEGVVSPEEIIRDNTLVVVVATSTVRVPFDVWEVD